jgi:hypothetical protein
VGLTTGAYAASLLVVSRLQIATDQQLIQDRTPAEAAISALGDHHDWMDDRLEDARSQYAIGAAGYDAIRARLAHMDEKLARLDSAIRAVERIGNGLSTKLDLPGVPTVGKSSGSTKSSSGGSGGSTAKAPPPVPKPTPPPATGGQTGASGG